MPGSFELPESASWTIEPGADDAAGLRVMLSWPRGEARGGVPLLLLLDGDFLFLTATEVARTLNLVTVGDFPPIAVAGVMRDERSPARYIASRFRDFTPQEWVLPGPFVEDNSMATMGTGGASRFLERIEGAVLPQISGRLSATGHDLGEIAIGGWSLSGLFASWAWCERPDVFSHLLSISPSLWWSDGALLGREIAPRSAAHRVFTAVGEHEEGDPDLVYPRRFANGPQRELAAMVRNAAEFAGRAARAGATVEHAALAGEHHVTVQAAAITRGLRHIYG